MGSVVAQAYGAELFGFLIGVLDERRAAREVYTAVLERLPEEAARFAAVCSARTLAYTLARRELGRRRDGDFVKRASRTTDECSSSTPQAGSPYRSRSQANLITSIRSRLAPRDLEMLILRIDRQMTWRDLAMTSIGPGSTSKLEAEAKRLRARFRRLSEHIERSAKRRGPGS